MLRMYTDINTMFPPLVVVTLEPFRWLLSPLSSVLPIVVCPMDPESIVVVVVDVVGVVVVVGAAVVAVVLVTVVMVVGAAVVVVVLVTVVLVVGAAVVVVVLVEDVEEVEVLEVDDDVEVEVVVVGGAVVVVEEGDDEPILTIFAIEGTPVALTMNSM